MHNINDADKHTGIHIIIMVRNNFQKMMWCWKCVGGYVVLVGDHSKMLCT